MGAPLSEHHRRKVSSASCSRLNEQDRSGAQSASEGGGRNIAPHLLMLVAAILIGAALGLAYQRLAQTHPGVKKVRHPKIRAEPSIERHAVAWDMSTERGVLGAGTFGGGSSRAIHQENLLQGEEGSAALNVDFTGEAESGGTDVSNDVTERMYVHQPGEVVAEDGEGGKFVVDDKDRIVFVEKEKAERLLRGLAARRGHARVLGVIANSKSRQ